MIVKKNFGPDHPTVAGHLENLANLYRTQGRGADAEPLQKRAQTIRKHSETSEALETAQQATWEQYMRAGLAAYWQSE